MRWLIQGTFVLVLLGALILNSAAANPMVILMPRTRLFGTLSLKTFENVKSMNMSFTSTNYAENMSMFEAVFIVIFKQLPRYCYYNLIRVNVRVKRAIKCFKEFQVSQKHGWHITIIICAVLRCVNSSDISFIFLLGKLIL